MPNSVIDEFRGAYYFLSNFYECSVTYKGLTYQNNEAAFQAQKTLSDEDRKSFTTLNPSESKRKGRHVKLRPDWESVKFKIMEEIVRAKFTQNKELRTKLIQTGESILIEGNTWGDRVWGQVNGVGQNNLGKILMKVRNELSPRS